MDPQRIAALLRPESDRVEWKASSLTKVLEEEAPEPLLTIDRDPNCLFTIKHMASLAPIAQQSRKPMFDLRQADGIGGGQVQAVARCRKDFRALCGELLARLDAR